MYLSNVIDDCFEKNKTKLSGYVSYKALIRRLNLSFSPIEKLKFKSVKYDDLEVNEFLVGGLYDQNTNCKYVILNLSSYTDEMYIDNLIWKDFKFAISQTIQHEAIHELQFQNRTYDDDHIKLDFRIRVNDPSQEREYLSDMDEIDAYAHDIAMEIKHYYPHIDPYEVLKGISCRRKLSSYKYYTRTFKGCEWADIKKRLFLKTYKWLAYV